MPPALAATAHGDNLWLFGLDGTLGPAPAPGAGEGIQHAGAAPQKAAPPLVGNAANGATVFAANCTVCHGASGQGGNGGPNLTKIPAAKQYSAVFHQVRRGGGGMPPFQGTLTDQEITDVATYVIKNITHGQ